MKKQILIVIIITILLMIIGILGFVIGKRMYNKPIIPDILKYSYILETTVGYGSDKEEVMRIQTLYIFDENDVCIEIQRQNIFSDNELYINSKESGESYIKSNSDNGVELYKKVLYDDTNHIITHILKFEYNEENNKEDILNVIKSNESNNSDTIVRTHEVF